MPLLGTAGIYGADGVLFCEGRLVVVLPEP